MTPIRIQRQRTRGWRMPPNTVYVGRPTVFGNPFSTAQEFMAFLQCPRVALTRDYQCVRDRLVARMQTLRGRHLACWCPLDQPCHADVLLEIANR